VKKTTPSIIYRFTKSIFCHKTRNYFQKRAKNRKKSEEKWEKWWLGGWVYIIKRFEEVKQG
jgi:hypothetical protein